MLDEGDSLPDDRSPPLETLPKLDVEAILDIARSSSTGENITGGSLGGCDSSPCHIISSLSFVAQERVSNNPRMRIVYLGFLLLHSVSVSAQLLESTSFGNSLRISSLAASSTVNASPSFTIHSKDAITFSKAPVTLRPGQTRNHIKPATTISSTTSMLNPSRGLPFTKDPTLQTLSTNSIQSSAMIATPISPDFASSTATNLVSSATTNENGTLPTPSTQQLSKVEMSRHAVAYIVLGVLGGIFLFGALGLCLATSRNSPFRKLGVCQSSNPRFTACGHSSSMGSLSLQGDFIRPKEEILGAWSRSESQINQTLSRRQEMDY
jgi:hypothetical protein